MWDTAPPKGGSICPQQANAQLANTAFPRVYRMHVKDKVGAVSNE